MNSSRLSERQILFVKQLVLFLHWATLHGMDVTLGEAWRPPEMVEIYRKQGKTEAKYSKHPDRLAIDLNLFINGKYTPKGEDYRPLGEFWESIGGRWGGRFGVPKKDWDKKIGWDGNHFEYKTMYSYKRAIKQVIGGGINE